MDEILNRQVGADLSVDIDLSRYSYISESHLSGARVQVMKDGVVCHEYTENLPDIRFTVLPSCLSEDSFWFSVVLVLDELHYLSSNPQYVPAAPDTRKKSNNNQITLVLPLTLDDVSRSFILLNSLKVLDASVVRELLVFTRESDLEALQLLLLGPLHELSFTTRLLSESVLFGSTSLVGAYPYAIQMAVKLFAASVVTTPFYLTLDADLILLRSFSYEEIVDEHGKGSYHHEPRLEVHPVWWEGSEQVLQVTSTNELRVAQGFGVTPSLLHTYGALLVIGRLTSLYGMSNDNSLSQPWIAAFGRNGVLWSEYTLYRITLDFFQVFDEIHTRFLPTSSTLHCNDVWYERDLPWNAESACRSCCIFSVVQSSTGVSPSTIYGQYKRAIGPSGCMCD